MRALGLLLVVLAAPLAALAASGRTIRAEVTAIHQLPAELSGAKFAFVPTAEQAASPEFTGYQEQARKGLVSHGLVEAALADADLAVGLVCIAVKGQPAQLVPDMGTTSFGVNTRANADAATGAPNTNSSLTPMYGSDINASASGYTRRVTLMLYAVKSAAGGKPREVYEGTATSVGSSDELVPVAPRLIEALLADFPGKSGVSRTVRLGCPDCKR